MGTAGARSDGAFGFRTFSESATVTLRLLRRIDAPNGRGTVAIEAPDGEWTAKDGRGDAHRFSWRARVKQPTLSTFGVTMRTSSSAAAELQRLGAAVEDVARHIPEDAETRALELEVTVRRNGRERAVTRFVARR